MILRDVYFCLYMFMFIIPDLCEFTPLYIIINGFNYLFNYFHIILFSAFI